MSSLLIVTGPPGAGKSTVARELVRMQSPSVLVEGDAFFGFLANGAIEPWLPESSAQNDVVTEAAAMAAGRFAADYNTVYDGIIGPWYLPTFTSAVGVQSFDYLILLPPVGTCVDRVLSRSGHGFTDEAATRHMHSQFDSAGVEDRHVIRSDAGLTDLIDEITVRRATSQLTFICAR